MMVPQAVLDTPAYTPSYKRLSTDALERGRREYRYK
jgi:hypothetical protein